MTAIRRILTSTNWKYAAGEVFLIFVGIILALSANSWYENRNERLDERDVLFQLKSALEIDLGRIESDLEILLQMENNLDSLVLHMDSEAPFTRELVPKFGSVRRWVGIRSMTAPYEALKSRGLNLISDSTLLLNIVYYYESQFPLVQNTYLNDRAFVTSRVGPFFDENFRAETPTDLVPIDYESLRSNQKFRNLCMGKLLRLRSRVVPNYEETIEVIRRLTLQIDEQSAKL